MGILLYALALLIAFPLVGILLYNPLVVILGTVTALICASAASDSGHIRYWYALFGTCFVVGALAALTVVAGDVPADEVRSSATGWAALALQGLLAAVMTWGWRNSK